MITAETEFPFGKYAGTKAKDLPSTYIIHALEVFKLTDLWKELLVSILSARLNLFTETDLWHINSCPFNLNWKGKYIDFKTFTDMLYNGYWNDKAHELEEMIEESARQRIEKIKINKLFLVTKNGEVEL